ncbi:MAG TPA: hypothetical protein VIF64_10435 [Pyrinomonadaceae bacterium]
MSMARVEYGQAGRVSLAQIAAETRPWKFGFSRLIVAAIPMLPDQ